jgi:uncharacterized DUF497 family protein
MPLRFVWDAKKADANRRKHRVSFEEALAVFGDAAARIHDDPIHSIDEVREIIVGHSNRRRVLLVSFVERDGFVRIISARRATRHEKEDYENRD